MSLDPGLGLVVLQEPSDADVLIYNTCSIREKVRWARVQVACGGGSADPTPPSVPPVVRWPVVPFHLPSLSALGSHSTPPVIPSILFLPWQAELKLYSALGKQAKRKRQAMGDLKIVVAGCVAAQVGHPSTPLILPHNLMISQPVGQGWLQSRRTLRAVNWWSCCCW